jgi:predicted RNase H-like nuclease (RuvC/YqgF family)
MRYLWMAVLSALLVIPGICTAEFYKYVDKDGVVRFTDDISQVPEDQRKDVDTFKSVEPPPALETQEGSGSADAGQESAAPQKGQLDARQQQLQAEIQQLDAEYQGLMEEKAALEQELSTVRTKPKMRVYNEKVRVLNEKLSEYSNRRSELEKETQMYNETAKAVNEQLRQLE